MLPIPQPYTDATRDSLFPDTIQLYIRECVGAGERELYKSPTCAAQAIIQKLIICIYEL